MRGPSSGAVRVCVINFKLNIATGGTGRNAVTVASRRRTVVPQPLLCLLVDAPAGCAGQQITPPPCSLPPPSHLTPVHPLAHCRTAAGVIAPCQGAPPPPPRRRSHPSLHDSVSSATQSYSSSPSGTTSAAVPAAAPKARRAAASCTSALPCRSLSNNTRPSHYRSSPCRSANDTDCCWAAKRVQGGTSLLAAPCGCCSAAMRCRKRPRAAQMAASWCVRYARHRWRSPASSTSSLVARD